MILQREIAAIAQDKNIAKLTIDKDWVLGHLSMKINQQAIRFL
jgi:hypothetical protein